MKQRRAEDQGWLCITARRAADFWDWVDRRQLDAHVISAIILYGSIVITEWAMQFAKHGDRPGIEIAAIIGAVVGPWSVLQGAAIKFHFEARQRDFTPK